MFQFVIGEFLAERTDTFDIALVDCPPNFHQCSWTARVAADYAIVPVIPEDFGTQGLRAVHQAIEQARHLNPRLRRLGHLISRRDGRLVIHRVYEKRLREVYGPMILNSAFPELNPFKTGVSSRTPVEWNEPRSEAANLTRKLGCEILDRIAEKTARRHVA